MLVWLLLMIIDMNTTNNTNVMAICQIFAQKQGGQIAPLNRRNDARSVPEDVTVDGEADKSCEMTTNNRQRCEKTRFDDTLRKKMDAETSPKPDNSKSSKKKDLNEKGDADRVSDAPIQPEQAQSNVPKPGHTLQLYQISGATDQTVGTQAKDSPVTADRVSQNAAMNLPINKDAQSVVSGAELPSASDAGLESNPAAVNKNSEPQPSTSLPGDTISADTKTGIINEMPVIKRTEKPAAGHFIPNVVQEQKSVKKADGNEAAPFMVRQDTSAGKSDAQTGDPAIHLPQDTQPADASKEKAFIHRMNVSMEQIETIKAEKQHQLTEKTDLKAESGFDKQILADIGIPQAAAEKAPISARPAEIIINEGSKLNVGHQIQESVRTSYQPGTQQIIIRLDPPDLGRVTIRFSEQKDGITGMLYVDKPDTKYEIQQALPSILQTLQNADIQIRKMEVVLNNPQQENSTGEFTNPNDGFQQQHASSRHGGSGMSFEQDSSQANGYSSPDSTMELSDKSINMLI